MPLAGDHIGPYTLIRQIGRGGFGVVWLAELRTAIVTTEVAIKISHRDDVNFDAIKQEASVWAQAGKHPNVLPIIEANVYGDQVVIVSEYAPDGSLADWLTRYGGAAQSIDSAINITEGILAGLEHLHAKRIIHRDVKPANILFLRETPRLADFGISRVLKTSHSGIPLGTPAYMAPEAIDGQRSVQIDIWSVGVMFYQLVTGRLPFPQTTNPIALIYTIQNGQADPLPSSIPQSIQEIIACALNKNPSQRYGSAAEMRTALQRAKESSQEKLPPTVIDHKYLPLPKKTTVPRLSSTQTQLFSYQALADSFLPLFDNMPSIPVHVRDFSNEPSFSKRDCVEGFFEEKYKNSIGEIWINLERVIDRANLENTLKHLLTHAWVHWKGFYRNKIYSSTEYDFWEKNRWHNEWFFWKARQVGVDVSGIIARFPKTKPIYRKIQKGWRVERVIAHSKRKQTFVNVAFLTPVLLLAVSFIAFMVWDVWKMYQYHWVSPKFGILRYEYYYNNGSGKPLLERTKVKLRGKIGRDVYSDAASVSYLFQTIMHLDEFREEQHRDPNDQELDEIVERTIRECGLRAENCWH